MQIYVLWSCLLFSMSSTNRLIRKGLKKEEKNIFLWVTGAYPEIFRGGFIVFFGGGVGFRIFFPKNPIKLEKNLKKGSPPEYAPDEWKALRFYSKFLNVNLLWQILSIYPSIYFSLHTFSSMGFIDCMLSFIFSDNKNKKQICSRYHKAIFLPQHIFESFCDSRSSFTVHSTIVRNSKTEFLLSD